MQKELKRQKKIIPVFSSFWKNKNEPSTKLVHSVSRGKKFYKTSQKSSNLRGQTYNQMPSKTKRQQGITPNDYGLKNRNKLANINQNERGDIQNSQKMTFKKDQPKLENKTRFNRNKLFKKNIKSPQRSASYDSLMKLSVVITPKEAQNSYIKRVNDKFVEPPSPQATIDTRDYNNALKSLEQQNQYFEGLNLNYQQQIQTLKKAAQQQKKKYERVKQIYQQKIHRLNTNKQSCQKSFGHIFSYDSFPKDIVPDDVIVQDSLECSREETHRTRRVSDVNQSRLSCLSINSR